MATVADTTAPQLCKVSKIVYREDLYPRLETSPTTVQKYAEDLDVLPPIEVNQHNELIDGWHRWTAYKKKEVDVIPIVVTETTSDAHLLELAIERNSAHGLQLTDDDKQSMAIRIWLGTPKDEQSDTEKRLARILSVGKKQISRYLSRSKKEMKEQDKKRALAMWLASYTQEEISKSLDQPQQSTADWIVDFTDLGQMSKSGKTLANHADENFETPIYNVWKQQTKSKGSKHFGNTETRWVGGK